jgi:hypothetical protein
MLAGGMTIAAPSMMPQAAAAGALYVSAENAMFNNTFGGAQIIEVIVSDPNRSLINESQGEPTVKVDDHQLRMAQAVDGNWYAYFGDSAQVIAADGADNNLNFGTTAALDGAILEPNMNITNGQYFQGAADGVVSNPPLLSNWNSTGNASSTGAGQIGVGSSEWPIIQTYTFTDQDYTFDVVYEQAGADEVVSLTFDSADLDDYASLTLDRSEASQGSDIHLVITDNQLNIDPTAEDIVIFYTGGSGSSDGLGVSFTDGGAAATTDYKPYSNAFDDNGVLIINNATNGGVSVLFHDVTEDDVTNDQYMVFYEGGENSGVFYNTDDKDNSNLDVAEAALRGFTATFDYNDSAQSFVVANDFGVIEMEAASVGDVWNSGEALTVTLIDQDLNKNSGSDEDLVLANTTNTHLIPTLTIGAPLSIDTTDGSIVSVTTYSKIAYLTNTSVEPTANMIIKTGITGTEFDAIDTAQPLPSLFSGRHSSGVSSAFSMARF